MTHLQTKSVPRVTPGTGSRCTRENGIREGKPSSGEADTEVGVFSGSPEVEHRMADLKVRRMSQEAPKPHDLSALRIHREPSEKRGVPKGLLLLGAILVVAAGAAAYLLSGRSLRPRKVEVATASIVTEGQATTILTATGYVEAERKADLSPKITSRIVDLNVTEGTRVKKGDVIARLDSTDLDAQLAEAKANWINAAGGAGPSEGSSRTGRHDEGGPRRGDRQRGGDARPRPLRRGAARLHDHSRSVQRRDHGQARVRGRSGVAVRVVAVRRRARGAPSRLWSSSRLCTSGRT